MSIPLRRIALSLVLVLVGSSCLSAGEFAWWPLIVGDGSTAFDLGPNGLHGEIFDHDTGGLGPNGSVWVDDPQRGTVLGLAGDTAWVSAGVIPIMDLQNEFSWSFWARQDPGQASPANDIILGNRYGEDGSDTSPREFIKFTPNRFEYHMNGAATNDLTYAPAPDGDFGNIPSNDEWIHHAVVKDGGNTTYYRNGEVGNTGSIPTGQLSADPLPFGFGGQNGVEMWRGHLSDVQLYESALTQENIQSVLTGEVIDDANLYGYWPMNEGVGDVAVNYGAGADDAQINNADSGGLAPDGSVWVDDPQRGTVLGVASAWADAGLLPIMDTENQFTWAFWARQDPQEASPGNNIILGNRYGEDGSDTSPREFIKFTPDRFEFHMDGAGSGDIQYAADGRNVPSNDQWIHHVAVKAGDVLLYFRNGELANEGTIVDPQLSSELLPFAMGGQNGVETWRGYLSDVRLFDHALSDDEIAELFGGSDAVCDLNGDGACDVADIDLLVGEIIAGNQDASALADWLAEAAAVNGLSGPYLVGDSNLDATVDVADLNSMGVNWQSATGRWSLGDFNADNIVNAADLNGLAVNWLASVPPAAAAVPEPSGWLAAFMAATALASLRRRRRR